MSYLLECALRELTRRKWRSAAGVLGYLLAVATLVVLLGTLSASKAAANGVLKSTGTHFIAFVPECVSTCPSDARNDQNEGFVANGVPAGLFSRDYVDRVSRLPTVKDASPYLLYRFKDPQDGHLFSVGGFDPANREAVGTTCCAAADIIDGRFITPDDKNAAMLEEAYAKARELKAGDSVTIAGTAVPVVGIVNPGIRPAKADVYLRIDDARQLINRRVKPAVGNEANVVLVEVADSALQLQAIASVKRTLPGSVISTYACYRPAALVAGMNEASLWLLTIVIAVAAVALSLKSQLSSVVERRHDIGILKAIGWTDRRIVAQVIVESLLQAVAGGVLGCAVAILITMLLPIKTVIGIAAGLSPAAFVPVLGLGILMAVLGGVIAGIFPALVAARMRPAEALRRI